MTEKRHLSDDELFDFVVRGLSRVGDSPTDEAATRVRQIRAHCEECGECRARLSAIEQLREATYLAEAKARYAKDKSRVEGVFARTYAEAFGEAGDSSRETGDSSRELEPGLESTTEVVSTSRRSTRRILFARRVAGVAAAALVLVATTLFLIPNGEEGRSSREESQGAGAEDPPSLGREAQGRGGPSRESKERTTTAESSENQREEDTDLPLSSETLARFVAASKEIVSVDREIIEFAVTRSNMKFTRSDLERVYRVGSPNARKAALSGLSSEEATRVAEALSSKLLARSSDSSISERERARYLEEISFSMEPEAFSTAYLDVLLRDFEQGSVESLRNAARFLSEFTGKGGREEYAKRMLSAVGDFFEHPDSPRFDVYAASRLLVLVKRLLAAKDVSGGASFLEREFVALDSVLEEFVREESASLEILASALDVLILRGVPSRAELIVKMLGKAGPGEARKIFVALSSAPRFTKNQFPKAESEAVVAAIRPHLESALELDRYDGLKALLALPYSEAQMGLFQGYASHDEERLLLGIRAIADGGSLEDAETAALRTFFAAQERPAIGVNWIKDIAMRVKFEQVIGLPLSITREEIAELSDALGTGNRTDQFNACNSLQEFDIPFLESLAPLVREELGNLIKSASVLLESEDRRSGALFAGAVREWTRWTRVLGDEDPTVRLELQRLYDEEGNLSGWPRLSVLLSWCSLYENDPRFGEACAKLRGCLFVESEDANEEISVFGSWVRSRKAFLLSVAIQERKGGSSLPEASTPETFLAGLDDRALVQRVVGVFEKKSLTSMMVRVPTLPSSLVLLLDQRKAIAKDRGVLDEAWGVVNRYEGNLRDVERAIELMILGGRETALWREGSNSSEEVRRLREDLGRGVITDEPFGKRWSDALDHVLILDEIEAYVRELND